MLRLITDFDGPIIDVSERYYRVYHICLTEVQRREQVIHLLSKLEFWRLKRARVPEVQIAKLSGLDEKQAHEFSRLRLQIVHSQDYLVHDQPIPGTIEALEFAQAAGIDIVLMTMRRRSELQDAFERYNLGRFFPPNRRYCLGENVTKTTDIEDKFLLMSKAMKELPPATDMWMVGDTEADIVAAKSHGVKVMGILSGIRDRHQLERYGPHLIINHLEEAVNVLLGCRV